MSHVHRGNIFLQVEEHPLPPNEHKLREKQSPAMKPTCCYRLADEKVSAISAAGAAAACNGLPGCWAQWGGGRQHGQPNGCKQLVSCAEVISLYLSGAESMSDLQLSGA